MKATRNKPIPAFEPVTLILETQEEVDAIYAVLNHVSFSQCIGIGDADQSILTPYADVHHCDSLHKAIRDFKSK